MNEQASRNPELSSADQVRNLAERIRTVAAEKVQGYNARDPLISESVDVNGHDRAWVLSDVSECILNTQGKYEIEKCLVLSLRRDDEETGYELLKDDTALYWPGLDGPPEPVHPDVMFNELLLLEDRVVHSPATCYTYNIMQGFES